jgi:threonine/homoserine/homoserine lactone efflux protein
VHNWLAVAGLIFAGTITPGPNNALALRAGLAGEQAAILTVIGGVQFGCVLLLILCWAGITALLQAYPFFGTGVTVVGAAYLVWFGLVLMRGGRTALLSLGRRVGMVAVASLQFMNPKAWIFMTTIAGAAAGRIEALALTAALLVVISSMSLFAWSAAGSHISRWLSSPGQRRFDQLMGLVLVVSAVALILAQLSAGV